MNNIERLFSAVDDLREQVDRLMAAVVELESRWDFDEWESELDDA